MEVPLSCGGKTGDLNVKQSVRKSTKKIQVSLKKAPDVYRRVSQRVEPRIDTLMCEKKIPKARKRAATKY